MSDRLTLYFEPLDVLQFRDYRPFDAGYNVLGQSVFPLPGVFLGCVRAALFRDRNADFSKKDDPYFGVREEWARDLLGGPHSVGSLQLRGPLVTRRKGDTLQPYFPMPVDLVAIDDTVTKSHDRPRYTVLEPKIAQHPDDPRFHHRRPGTHQTDQARMERSDTPALPWTHRELGKPRAGALFLTEQGAHTYRDASVGQEDELELAHDAQCERADAIEQNKLLVTENRFGITRSPDTLTVEPQRFYLQRPYRLARDHGFAVEVVRPASKQAEDAIRKLDGRIVQLGGRGHRARVTVFERELVSGDLASPAGRARKLWFVTPAPLRPGLDSWPAGMAVVTERVQAIGGFDQAHRRPRPLLRALPGGSVVYIEATNIHTVHTELCGFAGGASPELERLQHAGFAMALPIGAGER